MTASAPIPDERNEQILALAERFREYLSHQTDIQIVPPGAVTTSDGSDAISLEIAFERLDAALGQLIDLASIYAEGQVATDALESLILPAAALAGEYLRAALDASWLPVDPEMPDAGSMLDLALPGGVAIDLVGVARAALLSTAPNLSAVARRIIEDIPEEPAPTGQ